MNAASAGVRPKRKPSGRLRYIVPALVLVFWTLLLAWSQWQVFRLTRRAPEEYPAPVLRAALAEVLPDAAGSDPIADAFTAAGTRFFPVLEPSLEIPRLRAVAFRIEFLSAGRPKQLLLGVDSLGRVTGFTILPEPDTRTAFEKTGEGRFDAAFLRGRIRPSALGDEKGRLIAVPSAAATTDGRVLDVVRYGQLYFLKLNREGGAGS